MAKINLFWVTALRLSRGYPGRDFMPAHLKHSSIHTDDIPRWLALFRKTAMDQCSPEGASVLIDIAERMAETLEIGLTRRDNEARGPNRGN
jgi:hemoglobin